MSQVDELLKLMKKLGGSDLHMTSGRAPRMRVHGELAPVDDGPALADEVVRSMLQEIASEAQWQEYEACGDLDFAYGLEGVARFRANYFRQNEGAGATFRMIPDGILSLEDLDLPPVVAGLAERERGLILVTGPTGSGKSTTLAAILDRINRASARHILTLEDPVEFVHCNRKSVLSHREVGTHTHTFASGLRSAIRQDTDVILVGEMRDYETISLALTAAEMGLLVFGTLHTSGAAKTIDRIIDAFPTDEQSQARISLAESVVAIVSQLLLPTTDGKGRVAALEILLKTTALPNAIREGNIPMIQSIIQSGKKLGMTQMDDSIEAFLEAGRVTPEAAYMKAIEKSRFESRLPKD